GPGRGAEARRAPPGRGDGGAVAGCLPGDAGAGRARAGERRGVHQRGRDPARPDAGGGPRRGDTEQVRGERGGGERGTAGGGGGGVTGGFDTGLGRGGGERGLGGDAQSAHLLARRVSLVRGPLSGCRTAPGCRKRLTEVVSARQSCSWGPSPRAGLGGRSE